MRFRLIPRDQGFFPLFNEAAQNVVEVAERLRRIIGDLAEAEAQLPGIVECERRGDEITAVIERRLNESFVTPFDREDILSLTETLDDVVDDILAACDLLVLHRVDAAIPEMQQIADLLLEAAQRECELIAKLPKMRGLDDDLAAIDQLESAADKVYRQAVARLFSGEYKAFDVLKWKDVFDNLEAAVDDCEDIANVIESIAVKYD